MIPKRAIFFWEGPEMSWLRKQSIRSFRTLNPTWEVVVIDGSGIPIPTDSSFEAVLRSDWARYRELATNGGFYFDTDIVFCKPIPDSWLNHDLILTMCQDRVISHIAALGSSRGNAWFAMLDEACGQTFREGEIYSYQFFGIQLATRMATGLRGLDTKWLPLEAFIPVPWDFTQYLWAENSALSPLTYGLHWFGGDRLSMNMEPRVTESWVANSTCMVARAIQSFLHLSGELEAIRDHLGV